MEKAFRAKLLDREILEKRTQQLTKADVVLADDVYIGGEIKEFSRREILNMISLMIPEDFVTLSNDYTRIKYPHAFYPQFVLTSLDLKINMGFNIFPNNLKERDAEQTANQIREILSSEKVGLDFSQCEKLESSDSHWFSYRSYAMDEDIYNMLLITNIRKRILQITFNCPLNEQDWKRVVLQIFESIKPIKEAT